MQKLISKLLARAGSIEVEASARDRAAQPQRGRDDRGATLILALIFLTVIGTIVGAMASWTSNDLNNTLVFQQEHNVQTALSSTTNLAIQNIRYNPLLGSGGNSQTLNANPPSYCWGTGSPSSDTVQGETVDAWCSTVWDPTSAATRVVTISACLYTPADQASATTCVKNPGLQTVVTFDDYSAQNPNISLAACQPPPTGTCGSGMTISSSLIGVTIPTVTGLLNPTTNQPLTGGPTTGGGTLEVVGTGFESGSTSVSFVSQSASQNLVLNGGSVSVTSPTSLTVTIPPATTVTAYNVVVTTPNGTSASSSASLYTYSPVVPTVTAVSTPSGTGSAAGGTTVTVTGTGFLSSAAGDCTSVQFVDTQNSSNTFSAASCPPTASSTLQVNATGTQLTVATPAISTTDLTYYVVVTTAPGGTSASGPTFTYQPLLPLVASVYQTSGPATTVVTVTGVGFITGNTTVQLVPTSGTGTLTLTGVTVSGSTSLTGTVPSGGKLNGVYYVEATTPSGSSGSSGAPQFTYT